MLTSGYSLHVVMWHFRQLVGQHMACQVRDIRHSEGARMHACVALGFVYRHAETSEQLKTDQERRFRAKSARYRIALRDRRDVH